MATRTFIELEFDTTAERGAPLGDIAASLVVIHDLLRDLAVLEAEPANVEYREIQVVGIEMTRPLTITLSLLGISDAAVRSFQEICRDVILAREATPGDIAMRAAAGATAITDRERARLLGHIATLQQAAVPLKRVVVTNAA